MPHNRCVEPQTPSPGRNLQAVIPKLAVETAHLDPGSAAALRRGPLEGAGAAAFWKLLAKYFPAGSEDKEGSWASLIQAIAVLTPKGRDREKRAAHEPGRPMGEALYAGGVSELRLARLLEAPPSLRQELTVRTCRRLAGTEFNRFNLITLGWFLLSGDDKRPARRIARDYYRAAGAAMRKSENKETSTDA